MKPSKHHFPLEVAGFHAFHHGHVCAICQVKLAMFVYLTNLILQKNSKHAKMAKLIAYMERADGRVQNFLDQLFASIGTSAYLFLIPFFFFFFFGLGNF